MTDRFEGRIEHRHDGRLEGRLDRINLQGLKVQCVIGVYPSERTRPQPLVVDLQLYLNTRAAGRLGGLRRTVDYARVAAEVRFLLESAHFLLLEEAAEALARYLLAPPPAGVERAAIDAVGVRLEKPDALTGVTPSLEVLRTRDEFSYELEHKPFGEVDVLYATRGCGVYRLRIGAHKSIPTHEHQVMDEREMVLGDGLLLQGRPVAAGTVLTWPRGFPHRYDNPTDREVTVLCVDRPSFLPDDEIEVEEPAGGLAPVVGEMYYPASSLDGHLEPR